MLIYVKKLNVVKEIDERFLSEWEEKGYKKITETKPKTKEEKILLP